MGEIRGGPPPVRLPEGLDPEGTTWFVLLLDTINFGSGYFPKLRKAPGMSGYRTVESRLRGWWTASGPPAVSALRGAEPALLAGILGQSLDDPDVAELMELFARAWRDLGELVEEGYGSDPVALVASAEGSPASLVRTLLRMPFYRDFSTYDGQDVPLLKRAQIAVYDLSLTAGPLGRFERLDELTIFADNLVPHVLRLDGVLTFDAGLVERIEREELIAAGSPEEVEIRACALHAVEEIVARVRGVGTRVTAAELDGWLWLRGGNPEYKARPRHRSRTVHY